MNIVFIIGWVAVFIVFIDVMLFLHLFSTPEKARLTAARLFLKRKQIRDGMVWVWFGLLLIMFALFLDPVTEGGDFQTIAQIMLALAYAPLSIGFALFVLAAYGKTPSRALLKRRGKGSEKAPPKKGGE